MSSESKFLGSVLKLIVFLFFHNTDRLSLLVEALLFAKGIPVRARIHYCPSLFIRRRLIELRLCVSSFLFLFEVEILLEHLLLC